MSIMHFDTTNATVSDTGGQLVLPLGGWDRGGANGQFSESVAVIFYGEGETGPAGNPGEYAIYDFGFLEQSGAFITQDGAGIENWLFRTVDITQSTGSIPGQLVTYPGFWTGSRTDWRALGTGTGIVEISVDTYATWTVNSNYGGGREDILGFIEFSKYPRDTTDFTFDSTDVNTGTDRITITGHGFSQGDQAVYIVPDGETGISGTGSQGDGSIVDNEFLSIDVIDGNTIRLGSNLSAVDASKSIFNLTGTGTGTGHILRRIDVATPAVGTNGIDNRIDIDANA